MKITNKKIFLTYYTLLFFIIFSCIFLPFFLKGNSLIHECDGYNQYFPAFVYIGRYLRESIRTLSFKQFDFAIGYGEGIIPALNYYGFGDPINLLSVFIPIRFSAFAFSMLLVFRIYLCGISMSYYLRKAGSQWHICLFSCLTYAFCSYSLVKGTQFYPYITTMILLPLMMAGIDQTLKNNKISFLFIFSVFLQSINSFYFLYMDTLFIILYFVIISVKKQLLSVIKQGLYLFSQYILGILMGAFIFMPAVYGFLSSTRGSFSSMKLTSLLFPQVDTLINYWGNFFIGRGYSSGDLAFTILEIICLFVFLTKKGASRRFKTLSVIVLVGYFIPLTGYVMNGFSYSTDRWGYLLHFIIISIMAETIDSISKLNKKFILLFSSFILSSFIVHLLNFSITSSSIIRVLLYIIFIAIFLIISYLNIVERKKLVYIFLFANIILNGCMIFWPVVLGGDGYSSSFKAYDLLKLETNNSDTIHSPLDSNKFSRENIDISKSSYGTSMINNFYGTTEYLSILNSNISNFYQELAISPGIRGSSWTLTGLDNRNIPEDLLSVATNNPDYLPIGITYSNFMSLQNFKKLLIPQKDTVLSRSIILEEIPEADLMETFTTDIVQSLEINVAIENASINDNFFTSEEKCKMLISINSSLTQNEELYLSFSNLYSYSSWENTITVDGKDLLLLQADVQPYYSGYSPESYWVKINPLPPQNTVTVAFPAGQTFSLDDVKVYSRNTKTDSERLASLREYTLQDINCKQNSFTGIINIPDERILFLNIPYSTGWSCYIDGSPVTIYRANIGFMGIPLQAGYQKIMLQYKTPGLLSGIILSLCGWLIFMLCYAKYMKVSSELYSFGKQE